MCGFAGLLDSRGSLSAEALERLAARMAAPIAHRGPDDLGTWAEPEAGLALGFRRLAIVDLSPAGRQPMLSGSGRTAIVFNGEIYNAPDLARDLSAEGARFRGHSDTEVLLEAFERWGVERTLARTVGMFALALWSRPERRLVLARDRLGKKPLFWTGAGGLTLFGSQPKSLLAHPAFRPEIDPDALALYLRHGYVPAPRSIFKGVRKLPAAHYLVIAHRGEPELHRYWDLPAIAAAGVAGPERLDEAEATDRFEALLHDAVGRRMLADVPLGAFLSGGVDSSLVVALMQAQSARPVRTFSIGVPGMDEAPHAAAVARHLGTEHTDLYVDGDDALALVPNLPVWFDEPFADSSAIPTLLLCELTRQHVTVALSGDGGDELFAGYTRYADAMRLQKRLRHVPGLLGHGLAALPGPAAALLDRLLPGHELTRLPERGRKLAGLAGRPVEAALHQLMSHWPFPGDLLPGLSEPEPAPPSGLPAPESLQLIDLLGYLPEDILAKVDRASMAVSLEARTPLLDHRIVELAWRLPRALRASPAEPKHILRRVLERHVPRSLTDRRKQGFAVPVHHWLRGPLRPWAEDLLDPARLRRQGLFAGAPIAGAWAEHLDGRVDRRFPLWNMLMFQAWHRQWLEGPPEVEPHPAARSRPHQHA